MEHASAPLEERKIEAGEVTLNVAVSASSRPPMALLHGVVRRWQDFLPIMPSLALRWQLWAVDLRGHGLSARAPRYLVVDYVRDIVHLVREHWREPGVLVGHSLGAMVAAAVAAELPDHVRAIVLEDPPFETLGDNIRSTPFFAQFAGMHLYAGSGRSVSDLARELAELRIATPLNPEPVRMGDVRDSTSLRFTARALRDLDPAVLQPIVAGQWLNGYDHESILRRLTMPSLMLRGDERMGGMLTRASADRACQLTADCTVIDLPTGHHIHLM